MQKDKFPCSRVKKETWSRGRAIRAELGSYIESVDPSLKVTSALKLQWAGMRRTVPNEDAWKMAVSTFLGGLHPRFVAAPQVCG